RNAERMSRLTEDLLILARVESGEEKYDVRPRSARALLSDAASSMRETVAAAGMELNVERAPEAAVMADFDAIQQVFTNLISNAVRYTQSGKSVLIGAEDQTDDVEFYVRDFGPGIPSEHLPRIFERFYRSDKARSRD